MYKSLIVFGLALFSCHALADQLLEHQLSKHQSPKHQSAEQYLHKQQSSGKSALARQEAVVYLNAEQTASILGDQADLNGDLASSSGDALPANEAVIYIASQHAENLLGDNTANSLAIESLNSMPATAAGTPTAIGQMGNPEEVIYISPSLLELILGND